VVTQGFDWEQYYLLNSQEDCPVDWMHDEDCQGCPQCTDIEIDLYERQVARSAPAVSQSVREADSSVGALSSALADLFNSAPAGLHQASPRSPPPTVPQASVSKPSSVGTGAGAVDRSFPAESSRFKMKRAEASFMADGRPYLSMRQRMALQNIWSDSSDDGDASSDGYASVETDSDVGGETNF
jgi:hypothetical protein